jgi:hypothetical protein
MGHVGGHQQTRDGADTSMQLPDSSHISMLAGKVMRLFSVTAFTVALGSVRQGQVEQKDSAPSCCTDSSGVAGPGCSPHGGDTLCLIWCASIRHASKQLMCMHETTQPSFTLLVDDVVVLVAAAHALF